MDFKRALNLQEFNRWLDLVDRIADVPLSANPDSVSWALNKNKSFSTKSLYRFLSNGGVSSRIAGFIWKSKLPLKIKLFLWQVFNNKLQVASSLAKRGWHGNCKCCLCDCQEDVNHVLLKCHLARMVWGTLQNVLNLQRCPQSLSQLSSRWLMGKGPWPKRLIVFVFGGFVWALWNCMNKTMIEKRFPKVPTDVIYTALSYMQKWSCLLKEEDRDRIVQLKEGIMQWLKNFKADFHSLSDVIEL